MNEVSLKYPDSSASTPFTSYIAERLVRPRSFTLSVSESIDFLPKDRVRPYLSAGVALSRLSWKQENTSLDLADPTFRQVETDSWSFWRWGFTLDGGVRFYSAGHFMVDAQGGLLLLRDKQERTPNAAAWLVKRENPLFLSVQAGVAF
jgi:opacity protein-like surface antigen